MKLSNSILTALALLAGVGTSSAQTSFLLGISADGSGSYDYNKYTGSMEGNSPIITGIGGGITG